MNKKLLLIMVSFLLILPLVSAVKSPDYYSFVETGYGELGIVYPQSLVFKQGQNAVFSFDVTNESDFHVNPEVTPVNCSFASVSNVGEIQVIQTPHYNNTLDYWQVFFNGSDTKDEGTYGWYLNCNTSIFAGWASYILFVTPTGLAHQNLDTTSGLAIIVTLLFIVGGLFYVGGSGAVRFVKNGVLNVLLKKCVIVIALLLLDLTLATLVNIAEAAHLHFADTLFTVMQLCHWTVYLSIVILILGFFFNLVKGYENRGKALRMGESMDEVHDSIWGDK